MAILICKRSEIENVQKMKNSEVELYIQAAYKREKNREILRDRLLRGKSYKEIISSRFPECSDLSEHTIRIKTREIQNLETKFYRTVRRGGKNAERTNDPSTSD